MDVDLLIGEFLKKYPLQNYAANRTVYDPGCCHRQVYFVESGLVREYLNTSDGFTVTLHLHGPTSVFPFCNHDKSVSQTTFFETLVPSTVRVIPVDAIHEFFRSDIRLMEHAVIRLTRYISQVNKRLEIMLGGTAYQKTVSTLSYLSGSLGKSTGQNGSIMIDYPFTHKDLSAWTGSARETISINMKLLEKKGLIGYQKRRIVIQDVKKLSLEMDLV